MDKISLARNILRTIAEKRAGAMLPLIAGAGLVGGAHILQKGLHKAHQNNEGFKPGGGHI